MADEPSTARDAHGVDPSSLPQGTDTNNTTWRRVPDWLSREAARANKGLALCVYCEIAYHARFSGVAYPSAATIADTLGVSVRSVRRMIRWLVDVGGLAKKGRKGQLPVYELPLTQLAAYTAKSVTGGDTDGRGVGQDWQGGVTQLAATCDSPVTQKETETERKETYSETSRVARGEGGRGFVDSLTDTEGFDTSNVSRPNGRGDALLPARDAEALVAQAAGAQPRWTAAERRQVASALRERELEPQQAVGWWGEYRRALARRKQERYATGPQERAGASFLAFLQAFEEMRGYSREWGGGRERQQRDIPRVDANGETPF